MLAPDVFPNRPPLGVAVDTAGFADPKRDASEGAAVEAAEVEALA